MLLAAWPAEHDEAFLAIVEGLQAHDVPVWICTSEGETERVEGLVEDVRWLDCDTETIWMRDYGPIPVIEGETRRLGDPRYYGHRQGDDAVPAVLGEILGEEVVEVDLPLEGGNLLRHEGLCVVGSTVHANHAWSAEEAAARLAVLDCEEVLWLDPLEDEPTAHIDVFSLIVEGRAVVTDPDAAALLAEHLEVVEVEWDHSPVDGAWPSLTNALVLDEVALIPDYAGRDTLGPWGGLLPEHSLVPVPADTLVAAGGAVHCVTRELPAVDTSKEPPGPGPEGCRGCASGGDPRGVLPLVLLTLACTCAGRSRLPSRSSGGPSSGSCAGRGC